MCPKPFVALPPVIPLQSNFLTTYFSPILPATCCPYCIVAANLPENHCFSSHAATFISFNVSLLSKSPLLSLGLSTLSTLTFEQQNHNHFIKWFGLSISTLLWPPTKTKEKRGGKKKEKRKGKRRKVKPQTPESANHTHHGKPLDKNYKDP